ncbi:hypothetical protein MRB53_041939 [Persea americana]|nr:hypothetical protein MRB53_041939 [Persea americana]
MLIDPETLKISAVLDFEFTNAMPAQFTYDPPWWLLLSGPEVWLDRDSLKEFRECYEPRMEQFLQALEEEEDRQVLDDQQPSTTRLSALMRDSWQSNRFWFNYAARKSFELDAVYWAALHEGGNGLELLDDRARKEIVPFVEYKMEQLKLYKEDCTARFSKTSRLHNIVLAGLQLVRDAEYSGAARPAPGLSDLLLLRFCRKIDDQIKEEQPSSIPTGSEQIRGHAIVNSFGNATAGALCTAPNMCQQQRTLSEMPYFNMPPQPSGYQILRSASEVGLPRKPINYVMGSGHAGSLTRSMENKTTQRRVGIDYAVRRESRTHPHLQASSVSASF